MIRFISFIFFIFSTVNVLADTVPAINVTVYAVPSCDGQNITFKTKAEACAAFGVRYNNCNNMGFPAGTVDSENGGAYGVGTCKSVAPYRGGNPADYNLLAYIVSGTAQGCPDGYTLNPDGVTCKSKECPAGTHWSALNGGQCDVDCSGNQTPASDGKSCICNLDSLNLNSGPRPWFDGSGDIPSSLCDGGCSRKTGFGLGGGGKYTVEGGAFTGSKCAGTPDKLPEKPPVDNHPPKCGATEGVMTSSSGTVACVPEGTPDARKPDVKNEKKTETFPDGSTKTTDTTSTSDPATGAKDTQTTTTSTGGQSGASGTTTSSGSSSGATKSDGGDGCQTNCSDTPGKFGEYGDFWKKKYPNGISGVLTDKFSEIKETPLFGLVGKLAPGDLPTSGACPHFNFSANIGAHMNFGQGSIDTPCYVFDAVRVILLITSLLLARRLIFGG